MLMSIVPAAALLAAFISLGLAEVPKSSVHALTLVTSAAVMAVCLGLARLRGFGWLREWGLGIAILVAIAVAYTAQVAGLGTGA